MPTRAHGGSVLRGKHVLRLNVVVVRAEVALEEAGRAGELCGSAGRVAARLPPGESQRRSSASQGHEMASGSFCMGFLQVLLFPFNKSERQNENSFDFNNKIPPRR